PHCHPVFGSEPTYIGTCSLSLHDALPIYLEARLPEGSGSGCRLDGTRRCAVRRQRYPAGPHVRPVHGCHGVYRRHHYGNEICVLDRKSTRLNSSHVKISYAVFCLKKKTNT